MTLIDVVCTRRDFAAGADNLRSAFNVGAIFRTAECFGVRKIFLCGYTATPDEVPLLLLVQVLFTMD
jgi:tRNA G18 (ribose-2'-O)-methylase SpoU